MKKEELFQLINENYQNTDDNIIGVGYGYKMTDNKLTDEKRCQFQ